MVPLILEISSSVKDIVSDENQSVEQPVKSTSQRFMGVHEDNILTTDPSAMLGRTRLNLWVRICARVQSKLSAHRSSCCNCKV